MSLKNPWPLSFSAIIKTALISIILVIENLYLVPKWIETLYKFWGRSRVPADIITIATANSQQLHVLLTETIPVVIRTVCLFKQCVASQIRTMSKWYLPVLWPIYWGIPAYAHAVWLRADFDFVSKMLHALPAWSEYISHNNITWLNKILVKGKRCSFTDKLLTLTDLLEQSGDKLFSRTVCSNHCLHHLVQDHSVCEMTLRPRGHLFNLPRFKYLTRKLFIFRSLYDYRWIHIIMSVVALSYCVITLHLTR